MLQASCGRERASGSREEGSELLINLVTKNRLKMLISLDQNGRWTGYDVRLSPYTVVVLLGKRQLLPSQGYLAERGKPDSLLPKAR